MSKTHWKKLTNPNYLGVYSLPTDGTDMVVEIDTIVNELVPNQEGKKEECVVAHMKNEKPLILNKTNMKTIQKLTGTPYVEEWPGTRIALFSQKVRAFGQWVEALRIRDKAPKKPTLPELTPKHESWSTVRDAIKSGKYTVDQYRTHFIISPENETKLCKK